MMARVLSYSAALKYVFRLLAYVVSGLVDLVFNHVFFLCLVSDPLDLRYSEGPWCKGMSHHLRNSIYTCMGV